MPQGCSSWGGIYGHNWIVDPARGRTLVALANTAVEGMNGAFAAEVALASSACAKRARPLTRGGTQT
ncbi:MAG: hypothetical protein U1E41_03160 [Paracoccus sp. (in: a-proteobacteria)]